MKSALVVAVGITVIAAVFAAKQAQAIERLYEPTLVGEVEVKKLPARLALSSHADGTYFENDNKLFKTLFAYIKEHEIPMTIPVEAEIGHGEMRFFTGVDRHIPIAPANL